jgi:hypothetical protein
MKKTTVTEVPDKEIELSHGDKVWIYIRERDILFEFYCDGTGNCFAIPKRDLKEMIR